MKTYATASAAVLALWSTTVIAQDPPIVQLNNLPMATLQAPLAAEERFVPPSLSAPPVTPELWVYSQELKRHDDPAQAVRRKAEAKADQRLARLAALKWYGLSNSRPLASSIPTMGQYSPAWIGNGWERFDWVMPGVIGPAVYVEAR
jgi:hypothetical protein